MRGDDNQQEGLSGEARTSGSSTTPDPQDRGRDSEGDVAEVSEAVLRRGARPSIAPVLSERMLIEQLPPESSRGQSMFDTLRSAET